MKIPVIGTAVVNSSFWVSRLVMSVDFPVERFIIVNNNGRGQIDEQLDALKKIEHRFIDRIEVCHLPANLGVAGAWNLIVKCSMNAPYWIIANDDVAFGRGLLEEFHQTAESDSEAAVIHAHEGQFDVGSWDLFLIRDQTLQKYGLFDENTYPAYNEDADYIMRFLSDHPKRVMSLKGNYMHGMGDKGLYFEHGGQTRRTDPTLIEKINANNELTMEYMTQKWGHGWRVCGPYPRPYDNKLLPVSYWTYDLSFAKKKNMGF
jgi:hypothetical protein